MSFIHLEFEKPIVELDEKLSMPTSNISRAIKQLEQQLNCKLIDRTTRKMRLTEQGKRLYQ